MTHPESIMGLVKLGQTPSFFLETVYRFKGQAALRVILTGPFPSPYCESK